MYGQRKSSAMRHIAEHAKKQLLRGETGGCHAINGASISYTKKEKCPNGRRPRGETKLSKRRELLPPG